MKRTDPIDLNGHGAIRAYFAKGVIGEDTLRRGCDEQQTNFSSPDNFPKEIAKAIKEGRMSKMGVPEMYYVSDMLLPSAMKNLVNAEVYGCGKISKLPKKLQKEVMAKISRIISNNENCITEIDNKDNCDYYAEISGALSFFDWSKTKEGSNYWQEINEMLVGFTPDDDDEVDRESFWKLFAVKKNRQPAWR